MKKELLTYQKVNKILTGIRTLHPFSNKKWLFQQSFFSRTYEAAFGPEPYVPKKAERLPCFFSVGMLRPLAQNPACQKKQDFRPASFLS